jgi:hypothetical protein
VTFYFQEMQRATILYLHCLLDEVLCDSIRVKLVAKINAIESAERLRFHKEDEWNVEWADPKGLDMQDLMKESIVLQSVIQQKTKKLTDFLMCINMLALDAHGARGDEHFYWIMALHFFTSLPTALVHLVIAYADAGPHGGILLNEHRIRDLLEFCQ